MALASLLDRGLKESKKPAAPPSPSPLRRVAGGTTTVAPLVAVAPSLCMSSPDLRRTRRRAEKITNTVKENK